jgi:hypothetical protein
MKPTPMTFHKKLKADSSKLKRSPDGNKNR